MASPQASIAPELTRGHWPRGAFARVPFAWTRALAQLCAPPSARLVVDALAELWLGVDGDAYQAHGVPVAVRAVAEALGVHATTVQRGLAWLLARGVVQRRRDYRRRRGFVYALSHPSGWSLEVDVGGELLAVERAPWSAPVLGLPIGWKPELSAAARFSPPPVDNRASNVHTGVYPSRGRVSQDYQETSERVIPKVTRGISDLDHWYLWEHSGAGKRRVPLLWALSDALDALAPGWADVLPPDAAALPVALVASVHAEITRRSQSAWNVPAIRRAMARAIELRSTIAADQAEQRRRVALERARLETEQLATGLEVWADVIEPAAELLDAELVAEGRAAWARIAAGETGEAALALGLLEDLVWPARTALARLELDQVAELEPPADLDQVAELEPPADLDQVAELAAAASSAAAAAQAEVDTMMDLARPVAFRAPERARARSAGVQVRQQLRALEGAPLLPPASRPELYRRVLGALLEARCAVGLAITELRELGLQKAGAGMVDKDGRRPNIPTNHPNGAVASVALDAVLSNPPRGGLRDPSSAQAVSAVAVRLEASPHGTAAHDSAHGAPAEGSGREPSPPVDGYEGRALLSAELEAPPVPRDHGAPVGVLGAGDADDVAGGLLVALGPPQVEDQSPGPLLQVAELEAHELGAPQSTSPPEQQQRSVSQSARVLIARQPGHELGQQQGPRLVWSRAVPTPQPSEDGPNAGMVGRAGEVGRPVGHDEPGQVD